MKRVFFRLREFLKDERKPLFFFLALLLSSALSFEAGIILGTAESSLPLVVEKPAVGSVIAMASEVSAPGTVLGSETGKETPSSTDNRACAFVGSKNSTLYHLPTCASAKRIKKENVVCFSSKEDAEKRGYKPGCLK